jgi:hypothetical protein
MSRVNRLFLKMAVKPLCIAATAALTVLGGQTALATPVSLQDCQKCQRQVWLNILK